MEQNAKARILEKLRVAQSKVAPGLKRTSATDAQSQQAPIKQKRADTKPTSSNIERFKHLLFANQAELIETTYDAYPSAIVNWINTDWTDAKESGAITLAKDRLLARLELQNSGTRTLDTGQLNKELLFDDVALSICVAKAGIADKGALLVKASAQQPRSLTLVPPVNMILIEQDKVYGSLESCFSAQLTTNERHPSNTVLITGPSKTADIQQTLAYGAHGPKRLVVVLINNNA